MQYMYCEREYKEKIKDSRVYTTVSLCQLALGLDVYKTMNHRLMLHITHDNVLAHVEKVKTT